MGATNVSVVLRDFKKTDFAIIKAVKKDNGTPINDKVC